MKLTKILSKYMFGLIVLFLSFTMDDAMHGVAEIHSRLLEQLLGGYNRMVLPMNESAQPIVVKMSLSFYQVVDVDVKNEAVITHVALQESWNDYRLRWEPNSHNGTEFLRIPETVLWLPDIYNFNGVNEEVTRYVGNVLLKYDGEVYLEEARILKTMCRMDMTYFPYDFHRCHIKFGSWSFTEDFLTLELGGPVNFHDFMENGEWELLNISASVSPHLVENYDGSTFTDVIFTVTFHRKSSFFTVNFVTPSVIVSVLALLSFCLPPNNGEKVNLCVTIVLGLIVFTLVLVNVIPQTAHSITGHYLLFSVVVTSLAAIASTFTVNVCYMGRLMTDTAATRPVPKWAKVVFINGIAKCLCMERTVPPHEALRHLRAKTDLGNGEELSKLAGSQVGNSTTRKPNSVIRKVSHNTEKKVTFDEEWYFLASVLDRIFLVLFCIAYIVGISAFLSKRPPYPQGMHDIDDHH
ncbi:neuronal acetylcholine receptor subunit alpha-6-like [Ptychodera flava]|uniref:neuronal acetylcholine receptor subunit alpha-6-like n=1 Tax=Ptychodera flava TaxID=63121 RepID=UPI003969FB3E